MTFALLTYVSNDLYGHCQAFVRHYAHQNASAIYVIHTLRGKTTARSCFRRVPRVHFLPLKEAQHSENIKNAATNREYNKLLSRYTYVLFADMDELFVARGHNNLLHYLEANTHRSAVGGVSMELYASSSIRPTPVDWTQPLRPQLGLYYNNVCMLNKMVLSRVPVRFTFGTHRLRSASFVYAACQQECVDPDLVILHTKCVTSAGWGDHMSDSFRRATGRTSNMTDYIRKRCRPKRPLLPLPEWVEL